MTSYEVSMELWDDNHALHLFSVRGEAAARTVHVQLKEQGNAVDLTGKEVRVYMLTPNGSRIFSNCVLEDAKNGKLSFPITAKALERRGLVECELWISEDPDMVLKVTGLKLEVRESIMDEDAIEGSDEFSALVEMLGSMKQWESEEEARKKAEAERMLGEQQRQQEETARQEAEGSRAGAEAARAAAEEERAAEFEALQAESQAGAAYAKEQGDYAKAQGGYAKEQGDYAKEQYDRLKDVDLAQLQTQVESLEAGVSEAENGIAQARAFQATKGKPNGLATLDGNGKLVEKTGLATLAGNGKLSLEEVPSANSMELWNLGVSEEIPKSSDLNNYTAAGTYRSPAKGTSETLVHSPRNDGGFKLIVTHNQSGNWISQIALAESKLWIRNRNDSGTWGEWESVFIESSDSSTQATQRNHLGMNKVLWEGTWSSGKITIPNANRYRILLLATKARSSGSSIGTLIVACNYNTWLRGIGGYSTATPTMTHYYFNAQSDSDTSNTFNFIECTAQRNDGTNTTELSVAAIYGVV